MVRFSSWFGTGLFLVDVFDRAAGAGGGLGGQAEERGGLGDGSDGLGAG
jgi:hypothetical protein